MSYYYNIEDDFKKYPNCWCYLIVGGRNTGKTYSALRDAKENNKGFIFIKRTNLDVNNLCAGGHVHSKKMDIDFNFDLSPFADLNEDFNWNIKANKIFDGLGGFWEYSLDDELINKNPIGYIFSLNRVAKFKGFGGLRNCKEMIFDEFIASPWERVSKEEGNQVMELYKTVSRDREHRGQEPLKLICLANANDISNPLFNTLQVTDDVATMIDTASEYLVSRGILIHLLKDNPDFYKKESETLVYKAMHDTTWGRMAFDNEFSRNDFSYVKQKINIKRAIPVCTIIYEGEYWYVWKRDSEYMVTFSRHKSRNVYDFNIEGDRKAFFYYEWLYISNAVREGVASFQTYRMFDVIYHFKEFFK